MASKQETADYILTQIKGAGNVYAKKMFGEYSVYCDDKIVALVADDQLFIKPTEAGRAFLGNVEEAPPYPGAKNWFYISEDNWDESEWLTQLIMVTTPEVPLPKKKKKTKS
ncbi:TfoX/Sxy family protein [Candidatus Cloacimonadota bacterium]|jgi:TfoX/Sxy family transcriptional regulator of competence genes|nr:TfoX/Sxy family protein [Candidatus Cloacimonadota bacterium]